jgi:hypothetical protein
MKTVTTLGVPDYYSNADGSIQEVDKENSIFLSIIIAVTIGVVVGAFLPKPFFKH